MTWYLESLDLEVWKTILFGYIFPIKDVDGGKIRKTLDEYNEEESRKFQLNSRAIYILVCAMDRNEYNRISQCKTAKKIWRIKLLMKDLPKSKILKLEFLKVIMKCSK